LNTPKKYGSAADIYSQIDEAPFNLAQIVIIATCVLLNILDGFDITTIAVSKTAIAADIGLTASQLGLLDGIALGGMCLGAMFLGSLADLVGRRKVILTSISSIAALMLLTAFVDNFIQFFIVRFLTGLGVGAMLASIPAIASEYSPEKYKAMAVTIAIVGYPAGAMLGGAFGPSLIDAWGWQGVFFFGGFMTLIIAGVSYFLLPESLQFLVTKQPENALNKANAILRRIDKDQVESLPPAEVGRASGALGTILGIFDNFAGLVKKEMLGKTIQLWATFFFGLFTLYFMMSWIPYMFENSGYTRDQGGQAFSLFNIGAIIGVILLGSLATRLPLSASCGAFLSCSALLMLVFSNTDLSFVGSLTLILVIGIFMQGGFTGLYACAAKMYPSSIRATGVGWAIGVGRIGAVIGPALAGFLIEGGMDMKTNFMLFAIPMFLSGILAYSLKIK